jgi:hypothetical protein
MQYRLIIVGTLTAFLAGLGFGAGDVPPPRWLTDWPTARDVARHSGKPIFAIFH